jgi:hypothetical protein
MQKARRWAGLFVIEGKIKYDFTKRTGRPVRGFGTATTKPGKYDAISFQKSVFIKRDTKVSGYF